MKDKDTDSLQARLDEKEGFDKKPSSSIEKRLNIKVVDPTLPIIEYRLIKQFSAKNANSSELIQTNQKHKISGFLYFISSLFIFALVAMGVYSLIDAIVIFSQWNFYLTSGASTPGNLNFVSNLAPAFLYEYFFSYNGHVSLGVSTANQTSAYALGAANASCGGFGDVSAYRFLNVNGINNNEILKSSLSNQIALPCIIQIIYSLIGINFAIILTVSLSNKKAYFTIFMLVISALWIII